MPMQQGMMQEGFGQMPMQQGVPFQLVDPAIRHRRPSFPLRVGSCRLRSSYQWTNGRPLPRPRTVAGRAIGARRRAFPSRWQKRAAGVAVASKEMVVRDCGDGDEGLR